MSSIRKLAWHAEKYAIQMNIHKNALNNAGKTYSHAISSNLLTHLVPVYKVGKMFYTCCVCSESASCKACPARKCGVYLSK
jgi:hypothetical protein